MLRAIASILAALITSVTTSPAHAQTVAKPDGEWRGTLGIGLTATSGNTDSETYSISGDAIKQTGFDKVTGYLQSVYGQRRVNDTTERTADQARAGTAYTRDMNDRLFGFGAADWDRNHLIDLRLRSVFSAGIGYHVVKRENFTFDISTGPAYNRERYATETRDLSEWLVAEESTHALKPTISFKQKFTYYKTLEDEGGYRTVFDGSMVFKVNARWNVTMTLNTRYQSNPPPGVEKQDVLFVTGLQYVFNPPTTPPTKPEGPAATSSATCELVHCSDSGGIP
jgi:putative salt-induced outer membrane protein